MGWTISSSRNATFKDGGEPVLPGDVDRVTSRSHLQHTRTRTRRAAANVAAYGIEIGGRRSHLSGLVTAAGGARRRGGACRPIAHAFPPKRVKSPFRLIPDPTYSRIKWFS
jgi:hypothetical protein